MKQIKASRPHKIKKANSFIFWLLKIFIGPVLRLKFNFKFNRKTSRKIRRPCLILCNHMVSMDIFGLGSGFRFGVNFLATDTLFRKGLGSFMMKTLAQPIPISKGSVDSTAVRQIMGVIKDGGAVAMFPSGSRSFFGKESTIKPSIAKLVKKLGVPLVMCRFRGGFFTKARWMRESSKGKVRAAVERVIMPEELNLMTNDEVYSAIWEAIGHNEFEWNREAKVEFRGRHKAEYLESALFWCPKCGSMKDMHSEGNDFFCGACGTRVTINKTGFFEPVQNAVGLSDNMYDWSNLQLEFIKSFDYAPFTDKPVFSDGNVTLSLVEGIKQTPVGNGQIELFKDKMVVCCKEFSVTEIKDMTMSVRSLNIYMVDGSYYEVEAPRQTSLFKYMICGYHLRNTTLNIQEEYYGY